MLISKTERKAALQRIQDFKQEFVLLPDKAVCLLDWYIDGSNLTVDKSRQTVHQWILYKYCGSIGCLGGYVEHSPLMKIYEKSLSTAQKLNSLYSFFGLKHNQAESKKLFASAMRKDLFGKTDKQEAVARLNKLIRYHQKALRA